MKRSVFVLSLIFLLLLPSYALPQVQSPERIEKVVATGTGIDSEKATRSAIRNAVEQVIGLYVSSDTIVQNAQVLKDEVLTHSAGYVKDSRVISEEKNDDGLTVIKIEALVISTKLAQKIESLNIATKKVEGESLFGEAISKIDQKQSGSKLLGAALSRYPQAAYKFDIGKPVINGTDHRQETASVNIPITVRWDKEFTRGFRETIRNVSMKDYGSVGISSFEKGSRYNPENDQVVCFSTNSMAWIGKAERCYVLDRQLVHEQPFSKAQKSKSAFTLLNLPPRPDSMSISLVFKDNDGQSVAASSYTFKSKDDFRKRVKEREDSTIGSFVKGMFGLTDDNPKPSAKRVTKEKKAKSISHDTDRVLEGGNEFSAFYPPGILWRDSKTSHIMIIEDAAFKMNVPVSMDVEKLKYVTKIEVSVEPWSE
jgi:hypothetical protein